MDRTQKVDGTDHLVQESSTADPSHPVKDSVLYAAALAQNQWDALLRYTTQGFLKIDNSALCVSSLLHSVVKSPGFSPAFSKATVVQWRRMPATSPRIRLPIIMRWRRRCWRPFGTP